MCAVQKHAKTIERLRTASTSASQCIHQWHPHAAPSDRQPHCVGLEAVAVEPAEWSVLEEEGWLVNVTFNRHVSVPGVLGHCPMLWCCSGKNVVVLDVFCCLFFFAASLHTEMFEKRFCQPMSLPVFTPSQFWAPHFHEIWFFAFETLWDLCNTFFLVV